jgi:two-component sensor histidine kinase
VRNVLSVVQAVVRLSFTPGYSLADVQKTCEGRLQALANAMSLLTASDWRSVSFRNLISEDIIPFADRIDTQGPDIALRPRAAQTFALLLYELAINAAKHGALSVPLGKVTLDWQVDRAASPPAFRLRWREAGGPPVGAPTRRGFGELLVRRIAPRDVSGHAKIDYEPQGFSYELDAALSEIEYDPQKPEKPLIPAA